LEAALAAEAAAAAARAAPLAAAFFMDLARAADLPAARAAERRLDMDLDILLIVLDIFIYNNNKKI
jgi:hypothetical protein